MKWLVCVVLAVGCGPPSAQKSIFHPYVHHEVDDESGLRLAEEIYSLAPAHVIYLAGFGWMQLRRSGVDVQAKTELFWIPSGELKRAIEGNPSPDPPAVDERARYLAALSPDDPSGADPDPALEVVRLSWTDAMATNLRRDLVENREATIPHVGHFKVVTPEDADRPTVQLAVDDELAARIATR